jgi:hypothetical protein
MVYAKKPESPTQALSNAGPDDLMVGRQEGEYLARTRPPLPNNGTWGDVQYPNTRHTSDPKAPKLIKVL